MVLIVLRNLLEMFNLCVLKRRIILFIFLVNYFSIFVNLYFLFIFCFLLERILGVLIIVKLFKIGLFIIEYWNWFKKVFLNFVSGLNCFLEFIIRVFFGMIFFWFLFIIVINLFVVGFGLIWMFGKFCLSKYLINVVFLVEYCFIKSIIGLDLKFGFLRGGEWKLWNW